jgi:predicted PurR-regulated permease PerM
MAGVSLFLAAIVAIFGGKLFVSLKKRKFEGKIAIVTLVCAFGLLLHCGFILYLSIVLEYDFTITVLMIVLSELLPIFIITIQFSFLRKPTKNMPAYNRKNRIMKVSPLFHFFFFLLLLLLFFFFRNLIFISFHLSKTINAFKTKTSTSNSSGGNQSSQNSSTTGSATTSVNNTATGRNVDGSTTTN